MESCRRSSARRLTSKPNFSHRRQAAATRLSCYHACARATFPDPASATSRRIVRTQARWSTCAFSP